MTVFQTKVVHSETKPAWNVVSTMLGSKFKLARVPYVPCDDEEVATKLKEEAFEHAVFISYCFDNYGAIIPKDLTLQVAETKNTSSLNNSDNG